MSVLTRMFMVLLAGAFIFVPTAVLAAPSPTPALALDAPESVARGDAFPALAVSDAPAKSFTFRWLGKTYEVRAEQVSANTATGAATRWQAVMLLPVPLEEKESARDLAVSTGNGKDAPAVARKIAFFDKDRPVQKLNVDKKYVDPPAAEMARIKADRELVRQALAQRLPERFWVLPFVRPVPGDVSSLYGLKRVFNGQPRGVHKGLDLRGPQGQPVLACADGQVGLTGNLYFSGNVVYINHGEGVFTAYLHLSEILVQNGDRVRKGQVIGLVGATGRVTGPHLHLSLLVQGESVDPQPFFDNRERQGKQSMSAKTDNTFEKKMARLQEIVAALESGDLPLEKGMALYKEGAACSRYCREQLDKARHELEIWQDGQARPLESRPVTASGLNAEEEAE